MTDGDRLQDRAGGSNAEWLEFSSKMIFKKPIKKSPLQIIDNHNNNTFQNHCHIEMPWVIDCYDKHLMELWTEKRKEMMIILKMTPVIQIFVIIIMCLCNDDDNNENAGGYN